jgi:hypothetical protein
MKFTIHKDYCFPTGQRREVDRPISKRNASKIVNNIIRDYKPLLPLTWESLTDVELVGTCDTFIEMWLTFPNTMGVTITRIYVDNKFNILQVGSSGNHMFV